MSVTVPTRRVASVLAGMVTVTSSRLATTRSSPRGRRKRSASPAPSTRPVVSSRPTAPRTEPSARPGRSADRSASGAVAAMTAEAHTVGRNGPGAMAAPRASTTIASSASPKPDPPCASGRCRPSQPRSAISFHAPGSDSSGASSSARASARAPVRSRNAAATPLSSRCSSEIAMPMGASWIDSRSRYPERPLREPNCAKLRRWTTTRCPPTTSSRYGPSCRPVRRGGSGATTTCSARSTCSRPSGCWPRPARSAPVAASASASTSRCPTRRCSGVPRSATR